MPFSPHVNGSLYILCAGLTFSLINTLAQYIGYTLQYPSTLVGLFQYSFAFLALMPWLLRNPANLITQRPLWHCVRVLLAIAGIHLWLKALAWPVPIWQGITLLTTSPLFATLGAWLFLKERVSLARGFACVIGFIGAVIILGPWQDNFSPAALLPLAAALCWAGYALMVKKQTQSESPQALIFYLMLGLLPMNGLLGFSYFTWPTATQLSLLITAGILTAIANYAVVKAYLCADAAYIQPFDFAKIPFNVALGWLVFGWVPPGYFGLGLLLVLGAICLLWYKENRHTDFDAKTALQKEN